MKKLEKGNIINCLHKASHHLTRGATWAMMQDADDPQAIIEYRHKILGEEIEAVLERVERIKEVATQPEVVAILNEEFGFGHDK